MSGFLIFIVTTILALTGIGITRRNDIRRKQKQKQDLEQAAKDYQDLLKRRNKK